MNKQTLAVADRRPNRSTIRRHWPMPAWLRLAIVAGLALHASVAFAQTQAGRIGDTFYPVPDSGGTARRFPNVSYDAVDDAYLVVWGVIPIGARYVSAGGTPLGQVVAVSTSPVSRQAAAVGAACASDVNLCMAAWIEEEPQGVPIEIVGRLMRYNAGSVEFVGNPFTINRNGFHKHPNAPPRVAYSPASSEFLVAWTEYSTPGDGWPDVKAQRVSAAGVVSPDEIAVAKTGGLWEGFPSIAYNSVQNEYMVAYYYETGSGTNAVAVQRVQPGTGALINGRNTLYTSVFDQYPEITYNSQENRYMAVTWGFSGNGWMVHGIIADAAGNQVTGVLRLAAWGGGDGIGVAYNPVRNSYLSVFQYNIVSPNPYAENDEAWGVEVSNTAVVGNQFQVTAWAPAAYHPSQPTVQPKAVANSKDGNWLAVASAGYARIAGQMVGPVAVTPPPVINCTTPQPAPDWTCDTSTGNWLPPSGGTPPPPPPPPSGCPSTRPGPDWTCDPVTHNWLPPGSTPPPPPTGSCPSTRPGPDWICDPNTGNWLPPGSSTPPPPTTGSCPSTRPGPDWTCDPNTHNWLPPGSSTPPPPTNGSCPSTRPGPDWTCDPNTGNWLPPGSSTPPPPSNGSCPSTRPGPDWTCDPNTGNWLPPGSSTPPPPTNGSCPSTRPGPDWTCDPVTHNWLPPGSTPPPSTGSCPSTRPGPDWTCDPNTGNWLPPGSTPPSTSACTSTRPGPDWTCDPNTGNWLPPGSTAPPPQNTSYCPSTRPGPDWTCDQGTGNWLPPGMAPVCPSVRPGPDWTCDPNSGNWLPPGYIRFW